MKADLRKETIEKEVQMFGWALIFLVVGIIALVLGFTGVAGLAMDIAWILFVIGVILFVVFLVLGKRKPRV